MKGHFADHDGTVKTVTIEATAGTSVTVQVVSNPDGYFIIPVRTQTLTAGTVSVVAKHPVLGDSAAKTITMAEQPQLYITEAIGGFSGDAVIDSEDMLSVTGRINNYTEGTQKLISLIIEDSAKNIKIKDDTSTTSGFWQIILQKDELTGLVDGELTIHAMTELSGKRAESNTEAVIKDFSGGHPSLKITATEVQGDDDVLHTTDSLTVKGGVDNHDGKINRIQITLYSMTTGTINDHFVYTDMSGNWETTFTETEIDAIGKGYGFIFARSERMNSAASNMTIFEPPRLTNVFWSDNVNHDKVTNGGRITITGNVTNTNSQGIRVLGRVTDQNGKSVQNMTTTAGADGSFTLRVNVDGLAVGAGKIEIEGVRDANGYTSIPNDTTIGITIMDPAPIIGA